MYPPDVGNPFSSGTSFDPALVGYEQQEYFISGTARSLVPADNTELTPDGRWAVEFADEAEYTTRVTVIRPSDPSAFNGTVMVEWYNVSSGLDAAPNWTMSHVEQIREGYAWVGVSAQARGVEGGGSGIDIGFPLHLKGNNPERYGSLNHPGDSFSYDIFSQAAQGLIGPANIEMLPGLSPERLIAVGDSQSAFRLVSYVNGVDPLAQIFDGFLIHSRAGGSAPLSQSPQAEIDTPEQVLIRSDVRVPVLTFQTETDIFRLGSINSRQPDAHNIALWEVAGTAHGDLYNIAPSGGTQDLGNDPAIAEVVEVSVPIPGIFECDAPINSGPQHWVMNAAVHALNVWIRSGQPPPSAPRLETDGDEFVADEHGNTLGGIRTAWVDVPVATLTGEPPGGEGFCGLFGSTTLFGTAKLAELYPDKQTYFEAMTTSVEQSVTEGFLRPDDAALILDNAFANDIGR
ncbi:MAG: hypothetical protein KTV16_05555 [Acidimicrobiia bacterium]|nr:hypothetical protein [Acidimicrobiia bacterium]